MPAVAMMEIVVPRERGIQKIYTEGRNGQCEYSEQCDPAARSRPVRPPIGDYVSRFAGR